MPLFQRFERNTRGRDFIVGDIHGMFHVLEFALHEIVHFNPETDRLFSLGDLVDRGPLSEFAISWLSQPWFHAVRGNHEQMCIEGFANAQAKSMHICNGGLWFYSLSRAEQQTIVDIFDTLPGAIEIDTPNGPIGLVHAEPPHDDWEHTRALNEDDGIPIVALWSRTKLVTNNHSHIKNIGMVYCGHTFVERPRSLGNVTYIDTGCCFKEALTLVDATNNRLYTVKHNAALQEA